MGQFEGITDWSIFESQPNESIAYPIGTQIDPEVRNGILKACKEWKDQHPNSQDFRIEYDGIPYRVRCEVTKSGNVFFLRRVQTKVGYLSKSEIPEGFIKQLLSPSLLQGGLILVTGPPGVGKSTTVSRAVVTRLAVFGGVAWTVEDPIEASMEGTYGSKQQGRCWQKEVSQGGFPQAMRDVMRCYPAKTPGILMVGEVRDSETADECLRAASNGLLVVATVHATGIQQTIERMISLISSHDKDVVRNALASTVRLIINQYKIGNKGAIGFDSLWVNFPSQASNMIAEGKLSMLSSPIEYQRNCMKVGEPVCK